MFGGGSRYSQMRMLRIALVAAVLIAGVTLHRSGSTYVAIRGLYLVAIIGFIAYGWSRRRHAGGGRRGGARNGGWGPGAAGTPPGPIDVRPIPSADEPATITAAGWFPDPTTSGVERYWDGLNWVKRRHRVGESWVED